MLARTVFLALALFLALDLVSAAPLVKDKLILRRKRQADAQRVQDQEKQLEQLVALAGTKAKLPGTSVQQSKVEHTEVVDGKEIKHAKTVEKVTDLKSGETVADVEQEVTQDNGNDVVMKTKVDLPEEGVHKEFIDQGSDTGNELSGGDVSEESIEFSPRAVAEYLLQTREFDKFYSALADLVNSSVMTEMEAEAYQQRVFEEYQRLLAQMEAFGEQQDTYDVPAFAKKSNDLDLAALYGEGLGGTPMALDRDLVRQTLMENRYSLSRAIDALLEAWWAQAYQSGDAQAQKLVNYLYYIVSKDDNPDDIGQIREILGDMLANALLDDLTAPEPELLGGLEEGQNNAAIAFPEVPAGNLASQEAEPQGIPEEHAPEKAGDALPAKAEEAVKQLFQVDKKSAEVENQKMTDAAEDEKEKE